jgi:hypothetical protein
MSPRSLLKTTVWFAFSTLAFPNLAGAAPTYADIAAHYSTTACAIPCVKPPQINNWYFWRSENRVEIRDATQDVGEIWRRDGKNRLRSAVSSTTIPIYAYSTTNVHGNSSPASSRQQSWKN